MGFTVCLLPHMKAVEMYIERGWLERLLDFENILRSVLDRLLRALQRELHSTTLQLEVAIL